MIREPQKEAVMLFDISYLRLLGFDSTQPAVTWRACLLVISDFGRGLLFEIRI
jgi:hypothetical protein